MKIMPTPAEANHVLYVSGNGGYPPGGFVTKLLEAALYADQGNLTRLGLGFPGLIRAVQMYKFEIGGLQKLRRIASTELAGTNGK